MRSNKIKKFVAMNSKQLFSSSSKKIISKFADKFGLVYFGAVDQRKDDHKITKGLSVSPMHRDNHYCVGSVNGYNVSIVERSDYINKPDGSSIFNNWLILTFDLQSKIAIPHFFIGANNTDQKPFSALFSTYPNMKEVDLNQFEQYDSEFTSRFTVYARPAKLIDIYKILTTKLSKVIGAHFWPLSVEQHNNVLYVYSTHQKITAKLLDTMLKNGLWLAEQLDKYTEIKTKTN